MFFRFARAEKWKKPLPHMGQKLSFCDTTQIDAKRRPLAYAYHHMRPF